MSEEFRQVQVAVEDVSPLASLMVSMDPWTTLGTSFEQARALLTDPSKRLFVAHAPHQAPRGFVLLSLEGPFPYVHLLCIASHARGQGLGTRFLDLAQRLAFATGPHLYICVSSFNARALALYERLGFVQIARLKAYIVPEHDEILLKKSVAPRSQWSAEHPAPQRPLVWAGDWRIAEEAGKKNIPLVVVEAVWPARGALVRLQDPEASVERAGERSVRVRRGDKKKEARAFAAAVGELEGLEALLAREESCLVEFSSAVAPQAEWTMGMGRVFVKFVN